MFKIVCLFGFSFGHFDYRHISRATTMKILSLHILGPRVLCPLTIGISAVVYFFASTGNFPCNYNINLNLFSECITVSIHCAPEMSEIDCIGRIESFWPKFVRGW